jgi:hypothetical protein
MNYTMPSHDQIQTPGSEGSCPPEKTDGDNPSISLSDLTPNQGDQRNFSGSQTSDPAPAKTGA